MDQRSSGELHDVFSAISDPTRREILRLLSDKKMSVSEITSHFPITRTAVSKHLNLLKEVDLVKEQKSGRERIYSLDPVPLKEIKDWLNYYEQFWIHKLNKLGEHLRRNL